MMNGMRMFLNIFAKRTGMNRVAAQATTVLIVERLPAVATIDGSPMSVVKAATM